MSTDVQVFRFDGFELFAVLVDGEPWFKVADVCRILDIGNPSMAAARLDEDEVTLISTEGRPQTNFVSEAGLFGLILGSRKPEARAFKRWVTHEVLPSIRRTGAYVAQETPEQLLARALVTAQGVIERKDAQIATLAPRAEAWDELASAEGDFSVADSAKMLARAGVETGPQRLFEQLHAIGWIFRGSDRKWRAYASAVSDGYLTERPQSHEHPRTRERVLDAPQVRVTLRGVERLRVRFGVLRAVEAS
ncbi:phage antirepressor KilAC domain-containing protein [Microbacterium sp. IEGM 1404]|uniref:phage antirepressor KilAC domain-containing protein n=1 Tax=Microbacterium sp. IEGM 1404 TaxID=3047084 RepID=UPI0024B87601|nr:phage antirepressor KilAC domain-containing protein [Microbacterium sp. IEGM 1404]MDI9889930.1 phage antirepressor KilAC domain-containing protein [Microbacterium sp. IEGM 1404]